MSEAEDCPPHPKHWIRLTPCDSESRGLRSAASDHRLALRGEIGPASLSIRGTLPADGWSKTQSAERVPNESGQDWPRRAKRWRPLSNDSQRSREPTQSSAGPLLGPDEWRRLVCQRTAGGGRWKGQQSLSLAQDESGVLKRFVSNVLPADESIPIDEKRAVQGLVFKVIVNSKRLENLQWGISQKGNCELPFLHGRE